MACLGAGPHSTVNSGNSLEGADEYSLEHQQPLRDGELGIAGNENAAMYRLLESRLPGRIRLRSGNHTWVSKTLFRERG